MTKHRRTLLLVAVALLGCAWLALFFSNKGVLVWGSGPANGAKVGLLRCYYFTATDVVERKAFYTEGGVIGYAGCPRLIDL